MIPRILHFVLPQSPDHAQLSCVSAFKDLHPRWEIKTWTDPIVLGDTIFDGYIKKASSGAQRADLIRLWAVHRHGGFYCDSDFTPLKPLDELLSVNNFIGCSEDGVNLTNAFFGAPPAHPACEYLIGFLKSNEPDWSRAPNETTGPQLFGKLRYRHDIEILSKDAFYPYNYNEPRPADFPPATFAIHEWRGSWLPKTPSGEASVASKLRGLQSRGRRTLRSGLKRAAPYMRKVVSALIPEDIRDSLGYRAASYSLSEEVATVTRRGIKMVMPGRDLSVVPSLMLDGCFEAAEERFVASIVSGGDWVIDVGANVGLYSLIAAWKCGPFGRVYAIEPDKRLCRFIEKSALANWFQDRLRILNVASTDEDKEVILRLEADRYGDQRLIDLASPGEVVVPELLSSISVDARAVESRSATERVTGRKLDSIFPLGVPIKLLKVDAEGHEREVLQGAMQLFRRRTISYAMIEMSPETHGISYGNLLSTIQDIIAMGYKVNRIAASGSLMRSESLRDLHPYLGHINIVLSL